MTAAIIRMPEQHQDFAAAREVLRRSANPRHLKDACDVLSASHDWQDILLVREMRNVIWVNDASDLTPAARMTADSLGQNAALFAALNRRRRIDRTGWIIAASALAVLMAMAVL